jgi:hypothetical protein
MGFTGPTFFFSSLPFPSEFSSSLSPESPPSEPPSSDPPSLELDSLELDSLELDDEEDFLKTIVRMNLKDEEDDV